MQNLLDAERQREGLGYFFQLNENMTSLKETTQVCLHTFIHTHDQNNSMNIILSIMYVFKVTYGPNGLGHIVFCTCHANMLACHNKKLFYHSLPPKHLRNLTMFLINETMALWEEHHTFNTSIIIHKLIYFCSLSFYQWMQRYTLKRMPILWESKGASKHEYMWIQTSIFEHPIWA